MLPASDHATEADAFYPPTVTPPPQPLSLPRYLLNFVRNPLRVLPAIAFEAPVVQYGLDLTVVTDPALVKRVLLDERENFPKTHFERETLGPLLGNGVLIAQDPEWRWQRQIAAPLFRHADILDYVPVMAAAAEETIARWRTSSGAVRRIDLDMTHATFRIISETMLHDDDPAVADVIERANQNYLTPISWPLAYCLVGVPQWMPYPGRASRRRAERDMRAVVHKLVANRRTAAEGRGDLLARLLAARDPESKRQMSDEQMVDNLLTFLLAGHETTSRALAWALYIVSQTPAWETRMLREIADVAADGPIEAKHIDGLQTVTMFLKETMRVYPPISSMVRVAAKDTDLGGAKVKAGKIVIIPIYAIHRHKRLWEDPAKFDPERFLPEREARLVRCQYMPFGAGPRICIGASFSLVEAIVLFASFLRAAKFQAPAGLVPEPLSRVALQPKGGMPLKVTMRAN